MRIIFLSIVFTAVILNANPEFVSAGGFGHVGGAEARPRVDELDLMVDAEKIAMCQELLLRNSLDGVKVTDAKITYCRELLGWEAMPTEGRP